MNYVTQRVNWYTWETTVEVGTTTWYFLGVTKGGSLRKAKNYFKEYETDDIQVGTN